jgi:hypothetical protein
MELFYMITAGIAIVLLILILTYFGLTMVKNEAAVFPPSKNYCPDGWGLGTGADASFCAIPNLSSVSGNLVGNSVPLNYNVGSLYNIDATTNKITGYNSDVLTTKKTPGYDSTQQAINFNDAGWGSLLQGQSSICALKNWANTNGIMWDGVSNYTGC